ncbi:hypothetical protein [Rhizobium binae]|uniref:hypothetical protein n=1 Tax=Rhizobium binae TaxID=1138190 RepID=UPI001C83EA1E|nr:hypothetical protein [Rhizobium binae]MBX4926192.1 hypothetical protein [Rhizobium binae]MBX4940900.1 hypothetical protein [Rhizobium binae]MBX4942306.1 hypothetical protein [Rhizobium binae]MBX4949526.1 hypothetical protein [Rhizobium binae]MBX4960633.1 hypothetical protein [Rhizobium binae]
MGRFFSGNSRSCGAFGDSRSIAAVSLFEQGCSGSGSGLSTRLSICPMPDFSTSAPERRGFGGEADTGFVTFAVYESNKGGKADAAPAEGMPDRLQPSHAGSRVVRDDILKIRPFGKGQWAGCDAGKGAMELTAGSLASNEYIHRLPGAGAGCVR